MSILYNGDCLEEMKQIEDNSIDLIFVDLPYGQTSCVWDKKIDLSKMWEQYMRIKKTNTPIFFTTTTKFGVEIINSAPKKCPFRYDIVWCKSAPAGFLSAKKMPMRKHEMVYVFYEKLPFYDLSSHKHKFIKEVPTKRKGKDGVDNKGMIKNRSKSGMETQTKYDPPLPVSVVKETIIKDTKMGTNTYNTEKRNKPIMRQSSEAQYDPPLPTSVVKEEMRPTETYKNESTMYGNIDRPDFKRKDGESMYDPPLPVSVVKEPDCYDFTNRLNNGKLKNYDKDLYKRKNGESAYDPPLPVSVVKEEKYDVNKGATMINGTLGGAYDSRWQKGHQGNSYDPPLPTSM